MAATLKNKTEGLSPERRARIDAETDRLHRKYKTLPELRKVRKIADAKIAKALNTP